MDERRPDFKYRLIPRGCGGTFKYDENGSEPEQTFRTGIMDCDNTVGVYLPIAGNRCFAAHIDAFANVITTDADGVETASIHYDLTDEEGQRVRIEVAQRLRKHMVDNNWSVKDVHHAMWPHRTYSVFVSPQYQYGDKQWPGRWVYEGISTVLHENGYRLSLFEHNAEGFVAEYDSTYIPRVDAGTGRLKWEEEKAYKGIEEPMESREWEIAIDRPQSEQGAKYSVWGFKFGFLQGWRLFYSR